MADEGCPNVQLDAPIFGAEVNMGLMTAQQAADLIAPCFEGAKATRSLHFCNGNLRGRPISHALHCAPWVDILGRLDGVVDIAYSKSNISSSGSNGTLSSACRKACNSPLASSTKAATGSNRLTRSASGSPIGRASSAKSGCGCRPHAASAATRRAVSPCCVRKWRIWSRQRGRFDKRGLRRSSAPMKPMPSIVVRPQAGKQLLLSAALTAAMGFSACAPSGAQPSTPTEGASVRFTLTAADGRSVTEQTYRGKWLIVFFGYTFCPDVCPTTLLEIAGALAKLGPAPKRCKDSSSPSIRNATHRRFWAHTSNHSIRGSPA